jgi:hypothetical protein
MRCLSERRCNDRIRSQCSSRAAVSGDAPGGLRQLAERVQESVAFALVGSEPGYGAEQGRGQCEGRRRIQKKWDVEALRNAAELFHRVERRFQLAKDDRGVLKQGLVSVKVLGTKRCIRSGNHDDGIGGVRGHAPSRPTIKTLPSRRAAQTA